MKRTTWKHRLAPFAERFLSMYVEIISMGDDDLRKLEAACRHVSGTNCGWSTYRAALSIIDEVRGERFRRRRKAKEDRSVKKL